MRSMMRYVATSQEGPVAAAARAEIADRFSGMLEFGTAGLRGALGAGGSDKSTQKMVRALLTGYLLGGLADDKEYKVFTEVGADLGEGDRIWIDQQWAAVKDNDRLRVVAQHNDRSAFELVRLHRILDIYPSRADALRAFQP